MGATVRHSGMTEADRLREGEAILSDRANGMPVSQMMVKYDCSHQTIYNRIDLAIKARLAPTVDAYREQQNVILDQQMERCNSHIAAAMILIEQGEVAGDPVILEKGMIHHLKAIETLNRVVERRARLNGLDAPAKVEATVVHHDAKDLELAEMVRQAKEKAATAG